MMEFLKDLENVRDHKDVCFLSALGYELTFETIVLALDKDGVVLRNTIPFSHVKIMAEKHSFVLQCQKMRIVSSRIQNDGVNIVLPFDSVNVLEENRDEERFSFRENDDVYVKFVNPFDDETILTRPILDLSSSGLSFRVINKSLLFKAQNRIEKLMVFRDGVCTRTAAGKIVYARNYIDLIGRQYCQVGVHFDKPEE